MKKYFVSVCRSFDYIRTGQIWNRMRTCLVLLNVQTECGLEFIQLARSRNYISLPGSKIKKMKIFSVNQM